MKKLSFLFFMPLMGMQSDQKALKCIIKKQKQQQQDLEKLKIQIGPGRLTVKHSPSSMSLCTAITLLNDGISNLQGTTQTLVGRQQKLTKAVMFLHGAIKEQNELLNQLQVSRSLQKEEIETQKIQLQRLAGIYLLERTSSLPVSARGKKERSPVLLFTQPTSSNSSGNSSTEGSDPRLSDEPELKIPLLKQSTVEDLTPLSSAVGTPREKKASRKKKGKKKKKKTIKTSPKSV